MKLFKQCLLALLPQRFLTKLMGALASRRLGAVTQWVIRRFIQAYGVNMQESKVTEVSDFATFNAFFTRALVPDARPIAAGAEVMVSPADGKCGMVGHLRSRQALQAKGKYYTLYSFLAEQRELVNDFIAGNYLTVYLSPKDYHRVHMPISGRLLSMTYVPGKLYSVAPSVMQRVDNVMGRNERVICVFSTAIGQVAVVLVGAMVVGSMSLVWHGLVREKKREVKQWDYRDQEISFKKGEEIGHFQLGSTVVVLTQKGSVENFCCQLNDPLLMGAAVATVAPKQS